MDEVRDIIMNVALKHNDSGEASLSRLARLILQELKENDYEVVKSNSVLGGVILCDAPDRILPCRHKCFSQCQLRGHCNFQKHEV